MVGETGLVAGVDCSTQGTKVVIVDTEDGAIVAEGRATHEVTGTGGARETHPEVWWAALRSALDATGRSGQVGAIAIGGQQHGLVLIDGDGRPLRPAMLWNDTRSAPEAAELTEALGGAEAWAQRVGLVPVASFTVTKWLWVRRHEPEVADAARGVLLPHDYLNLRLTGVPATDRGDASGTGWWSTAGCDYDPPVLDLVGLGIDRLPLVVRAGAAAGSVSPAAAAELGLRAGVPVAAGTGDNMAAALGLGLRPGMPVVSLGTSGTAYAVSTIRTADPTGTVAGFADAVDGFLPLACTLNCTQAVDRIAGWLGLDREQIAADTDVVVLPYLDGERTPNLPDAAGTIAGLHHTTMPEEILLAAYRGAAASLLDALDAIDSAGSGLAPEHPLVVIGGGAAGRAWPRVVADLAGRPLLIPDASELVAMGAAVQAAALAAGGDDPVEIAERWGTRNGRTVDPGPGGPAARDRIRAVRNAATPLLVR